MKKVVIDRSKWRTGDCGRNSTGFGITELKNSEGFMCCLGFICSAYKKKVVGIPLPASTECKIPFLTERSVSGEYTNTELSSAAVEINDDHKTRLSIKEKKLKKLFEGKIELEFVGEPVKVYGQ